VKRVVIYSQLYFPDYVGGGERLAELTAEGFSQLGLTPVVLTTHLGANIHERRWRDIQVIEIPAVVDTGTGERHPIAFAINEALATFKPDFLHVVGAQGAAEVALAARSRDIPIGLATTDYSLFCNTATLVRGGGSYCSGKISDYDCFTCRLENARSRDRILAHIGRHAPPMLSNAIRSSLSLFAGQSKGGQLNWWQDFMLTESKRLQIWNSTNVIIHGTKFAMRAHANAAPIGQHSKNRYCHHPVRRTQPIRKPRKLHSGIVAAFIGRAIPIKGLDVLLHAMGRYGKEAGIKLVVYSPENSDWPDYHAKLRSRARELSDCVSWRSTGVLTEAELDEIHRSIDVLVAPSVWPEYVGFVTLEALARGTPVVMTDFPPQRELFGDLPQVSLIRPQDHSTLISAIKSLAKRSVLEPSFYTMAPKTDQYAKRLMAEYDFDI